MSACLPHPWLKCDVIQDVLATAVRVADHGAGAVSRYIRVCLRISHGVRRPVAAGVIVAVDERPAVRVRTGEDVVPVARNNLTLDVRTVSRRMLLRSRCWSP